MSLLDIIYIITHCIIVGLILLRYILKICCTDYEPMNQSSSTHQFSNDSNDMLSSDHVIDMNNGITSCDTGTTSCDTGTTSYDTGTTSCDTGTSSCDAGTTSCD